MAKYLEKLIEPRLTAFVETMKRDYRQALKGDVKKVEGFLKTLDETEEYYSKRSGTPVNSQKTRHDRTDDELDRDRQKVYKALNEYPSGSFKSGDLSQKTGVDALRVGKYLSSNADEWRLAHDRKTHVWTKLKSYSPEEVRALVADAIKKGAYDRDQLAEKTGYSGRSIGTFRRYVEAAKKKK